MANRKLEIIFSTDVFINPKLNQVVIYVDQFEREKNQHLSFRCRFSDDHIVEGDRLLLGLLPGKNIEKESKKYADNNDLLLFNGLFADELENRTQFFTMQPTMEEYRKIVRFCGPKRAQLLLGSINDMVIHKSIKVDWFDEATVSDTFKLKFLLKSESFYTFHNADSLLSGLDYEDITGISKKLCLKFQLDGFNNNHEVNLKYESESIIPKRINILIGKNGVGKSQALTKFSRLALQMTNEKGTLTDPDSTHGRPMISRMIAIGTPGETTNTFPGERVNQQKIFYRRLSFTRNSRSKQSRGITETLIQLGKNRESVKEKSRWDFFWDAISTCLPVENIGVVTRYGKIQPLNFFGTLDDSVSTARFIDMFERNSEPKFYVGENTAPLSSGQLTFFKFALQCSLYIENGSFVLMDEPETHLHPNMISDFVAMLDSLLEATGSQALIATHSAYFVREVSREQVHIFKVESDRNINITQSRLRTFGADVESISQFVFMEDIESKLMDKIYEKVKGLKFKEVEKILSGELSLAALMDLRSRLEEANSEKN